MVESLRRIQLCSDWHFRQADDDEKDDRVWMPVAKVPTNVHLDLLANGKLVFRVYCQEPYFVL